MCLKYGDEQILSLHAAALQGHFVGIMEEM
jgi:hypothetical protein